MLSWLKDRFRRGPVVPVVRLSGVIASSGLLGNRGLSIESTAPLLKRAFDTKGAKAVALAINSPGGSPVQSALIGQRIRLLAKEKNLKVIAFVEDVAASGGYWLACAADEIVVDPNSIVGSIGVITAGFGLTGLLERFGVERRVYTAGEHKHRLDPFSPVKEEDVAWLKGLQGELHTQFTDWVKQRRGDKLVDDPDLFTGEVWTGARALELGLVDGLGSLREVVNKKFPGAEIAVAEPRKPLLARLGIAGSSSALFGSAGDKVLSAIDAVEQRAAWSRFGL